MNCNHNWLQVYRRTAEAFWHLLHSSLDLSYNWVISHVSVVEKSKFWESVTTRPVVLRKLKPSMKKKNEGIQFACHMLVLLLLQLPTSWVIQITMKGLCSRADRREGNSAYGISVRRVMGILLFTVYSVLLFIETRVSLCILAVLELVTQTRPHSVLPPKSWEEWYGHHFWLFLNLLVLQPKVSEILLWSNLSKKLFRTLDTDLRGNFNR